MARPRRGRKAKELPKWGRCGEGERQGKREQPYSHNAPTAPWPSVFNIYLSSQMHEGIFFW